MSNPLWYTKGTKMIMNNIHESWIAKNLKLGAIYLDAKTLEAKRLVNIVPCQGVWMENAEGEGYGDLIPFADVLYAKLDEVQDFLEDLEVFKNNTLVKD